MIHASLFSGIGGPEVAAAMLGWDNAFHCEINPFGRAILEYWFPKSTSYDDITKTDFRSWRGKIDILTGGFPCQPFSYAGRRGGQTITVTSGRRCSALLTKSGPLGSLVKTLLASPRWSKEGFLLKWEAAPLYSARVTAFTDTNLSKPSPSNESAKTLNASDIPSSRCLFRLRLSELPTEGIVSSSSLIGTPTGLGQSCPRSEKFRRGARPNPGEYAQEYAEKFAGLLQTPTAVMTVEKPEDMRARAERNGYKNGTKYGSLESQIMYDPKCAKMLPTPQTSDCGTPLDPKQKAEYVEKWRAKGITPSASYQLRQMAYDGLLPTPRANKVTDTDLNNPNIASRNKSNLEEEVAKMIVSFTKVQQGVMLPTPTAGEAEKYRLQYTPGSQMGTSLSAMGASGMLPTPIAGDTHGQRRGEGKGKESMLSGVVENSCPKTAGGTFRLSPLFTEEMMGFPLMWTTLPFLQQSGEPKASKPTGTQ